LALQLVLRAEVSWVLLSVVVQAVAVRAPLLGSSWPGLPLPVHCVALHRLVEPRRRVGALPDCLQPHGLVRWLARFSHR
jgi:hypothetical protein